MVDRTVALVEGPGAAAIGTLDRRQAGSIGRHARLELVFRARRGRTELAHAYAEPPFRIGRALDAPPFAHVIVTCCGPGVFGGDRLEQHVTVEAGARVLLASPAALQVHPGGGAAVIRSSVTIEADGELDGWWDPVIPFAGARLTEQIELHAAAGARLFWSDALMAGRVGRGEAWRFDDLDREMRLYIGGSLQYLERYRLTPASVPVGRTWVAGDANYLGTTIALHPDATAERAEIIQQTLAGQNGVRAGVDVLAANLLIGRVLARKGPPFAAARAVFRQAFGRPSLRRL